MYILKNAMKCILRSKGRNILIGVIVLVIAVSACIGLSIRQAAESAKAETLESMRITATISFDRASMMRGMADQQGGDPRQQGFDRSQFAQRMGQFSTLSLEEYQTYAAAPSVKDFYYTMTASLNGSDEFQPVTSEESTEMPEMEGFGGRGGGMQGGRARMMGAQSDFSVVGVSSEAAMTSFQDGTASVTDGATFAEGTPSYDCIITQELASFNDISVGDTVTVTNPNAEEESYTFTVVGFYYDTSANESSFSMMGATSMDPANRIYISSTALQRLMEESAAVSQTTTDENTGMTFETAVSGMLSGTYVFADAEDFHRFETEVRNLGLDESYTVTSMDATAYENSLVPLNTLSRLAGYFLVVILLIGAVILIVLSIFNVRERKYEIGVLTAIGMKKHKVAMQFLTEIFVVTLAAVLIGAGIGAASAVPVTNALLENQVASQTAAQQQVEQNFGRGDMPMMPPGGNRGFDRFFGTNSETNYVTEVNNAMNLTVVVQMLGIAVLLTLAAGTVSMLFVMRYEPLKILSNRD